MSNTNNPVKPDSSDLHKAVARKLWEINCHDQTYDDALSGAKSGNQPDARAVEFIHDLADAAIAVVVEACAADLIAEAESLRKRFETTGRDDLRGQSAGLERAARAVRALARKEE